MIKVTLWCESGYPFEPQSLTVSKFVEAIRRYEHVDVEDPVSWKEGHDQLDRNDVDFIVLLNGFVLTDGKRWSLSLWRAKEPRYQFYRHMDFIDSNDPLELDRLERTVISQLELQRRMTTQVSK